MYSHTNKCTYQYVQLHQQMHISVCTVTYSYSSPHVSVTPVTIISVAYNNNTINIQIIVQKSVTKPHLILCSEC